MIQVCSLGGGKASTAAFVKSLNGELDNPADCAVFADPGQERATTWNTINYLKELAASKGVPVFIVKTDRLPDIWANALNPDSKVGDLPFHTLDEKGEKTTLSKYCTGEYKRDPIRRFLRSDYFAETMGIPKVSYKNPITVWLGYTIDEVSRMKQSNRKYEIRRFPLAMELRWYRSDCIEYLKTQKLDWVERSACIFCPYRRSEEYDDMPEDEIQRAIQFENEVNAARGIITAKEGTQAPLRIHPSLVPLEERPFENPNIRSQEPTLFDLCEGSTCWT